MALGFGDEFTHRFVAGDVVAWATTSGARGETRASNDDGACAAMSCRARQRAEYRSHARRAGRGEWKASRGRNAGRPRRRGGRLEEAAERASDKLAAGKRAGTHDILNGKGRGDGAEGNPEREHENTEGCLQRIPGRRRVKELEGRVSHEIENPLGDKRCNTPAQRPQKDPRQIQQVAAPNRAQRWNGHETNEKRRQRVTRKQDEFLDDICPKQEQRRELANQPQDTGYKGFNGEAGDVSENIPPGTVAAGVAFDRKELIVLVVNV